MDEQTEKAPEARTDAQVTNIATAEQLSWQTINSMMYRIWSKTMCIMQIIYIAQMLKYPAAQAQYLYYSPLKVCHRKEGKGEER